MTSLCFNSSVFEFSTIPWVSWAILWIFPNLWFWELNCSFIFAELFFLIKFRIQRGGISCYCSILSFVGLSHQIITIRIINMLRFKFIELFAGFVKFFEAGFDLVDYISNSFWIITFFLNWPFICEGATAYSDSILAF